MNISRYVATKVQGTTYMETSSLFHILFAIADDVTFKHSEKKGQILDRDQMMVGMIAEHPLSHPPIPRDLPQALSDALHPSEESKQSA